ncbi:MAG TPA: S-layer homology domain-containing protein [Candidatus Scatomorpha gallistercoris]|nr:S-layer homology domain-containing protein [Candidatus Scatomorpha gallistercoris]
MHINVDVNIPDTYDIDLIVGEGGEAKTNLSNASAGTTITVTATPDNGYELAYITVDGERIDGTTFKMPEHDVTVRVYFTNGGFPFTDVAPGAWYYDAVSYVYYNGLMDGVSASEFNPDGSMTRAMVWAILARIDGETVTGASWIETARAWAMAEGVSDGTDANGLVTREQLATMLWRYAGEPDSDYSLSAFTDAASVSEWAETAMSWAVENGLITGVTANTLVPSGSATRAQCAAILMRYVENI